MAIPSRQIGWGTEENLLWQISKQLESLTGVTYNSKKTILNTQDPYYNDPNVRAKIETFSGAWSGTNDGTPFLTVDLNQVQGGIIEFSAYGFASNGICGSYYFGGGIDGGKYINSNGFTSSGPENYYINSNVDGNLVSFSMNWGGGDPFEIVYTVKLFTLPMYND